MLAAGAHQRPPNVLRSHSRLLLLLQHADQLPLLAQHAAQLMQWLARTQLGPRKGEGLPKGDETALALAARLAPFAEQEGGHVRLEVCERLLAHACG